MIKYKILIECVITKLFYNTLFRNKKLRNSFETVKIPLNLIKHTNKGNKNFRFIHLKYLKIKKAGVFETINENEYSDISNLREITVFSQRINKKFKWENTDYFRLFHDQLSKNGYGLRKRKNWHEFKEIYLTKWDKIAQEIMNNGYKNQKQLGNSLCPPKEIEVAITKTGELIFVDGKHRFGIAKAIGLEFIPVIINVVDPRVFDLFNLDSKKTTPSDLIKTIVTI